MVRFVEDSELQVTKTNAVASVQQRFLCVSARGESESGMRSIALQGTHVERMVRHRVMPVLLDTGRYARDNAINPAQRREQTFASRHSGAWSVSVCDSQARRNEPSTSHQTYSCEHTAACRSRHPCRVGETRELARWCAIHSAGHTR